MTARMTRAMFLCLALLAGCRAEQPGQGVPATATPSPTETLAAIGRGVLRVATDADFRPFSFAGEEGELAGFDVEVAREVGRRLGVEVAFVTPDWETVVAGDWGDEWDVHVGSMPVTRALAGQFYFSRAYYFFQAQFAVPADSPVSALEALHGQAICVVAGSPEEGYLRRDGAFDIGEETVTLQVEGATVVAMAAELDCPRAWAAGRTDYLAWLTTDMTLDEAQGEGLAVKPLGEPVYRRGFAMAVDRAGGAAGERLAEALSAALAEMRADGTLEALSVAWFGVDLTDGGE